MRKLSCPSLKLGPTLIPINRNALPIWRKAPAGTAVAVLGASSVAKVTSPHDGIPRAVCSRTATHRSRLPREGMLKSDKPSMTLGISGPAASAPRPGPRRRRRCASAYARAIVELSAGDVRDLSGGNVRRIRVQRFSSPLNVRPVDCSGHRCEYSPQLTTSGRDVARFPRLGRLPPVRTKRPGEAYVASPRPCFISLGARAQCSLGAAHVAHRLPARKPATKIARSRQPRHNVRTPGIPSRLRPR